MSQTRKDTRIYFAHNSERSKVITASIDCLLLMTYNLSTFERAAIISCILVVLNDVNCHCLLKLLTELNHTAHGSLSADSYILIIVRKQRTPTAKHINSDRSNTDRRSTRSTRFTHEDPENRIVVTDVIFIH